MRSVLIGLLLGGLVGCVEGGPAGEFDVGIENDYAESIFTLKWSLLSPPTDGKPAEGTLFNAVRIAGYSSERLDMDVPFGSKVRFSMAAVSLGRTQSFPAMDLDLDDGSKRLTFTYEYDLATADFTVAAGWGYGF